MKNTPQFFGVDDIIYQQHKVMHQWFPKLPEWMEEKVSDPRSTCRYSIANLLSQGIFLFLNKEASRNAANNSAVHSPFFKDNFSSFFGNNMELAHYDTAEDLYRRIDMEEVEAVKDQMVRELIKNKRLRTFRGYYLLAIDATGVTSYDHKLAKGALTYKTSKNGKVTYLNIMLEAKIITPEGMSISIASEPLNNKDMQVYEKQDCELKAFKRITAKIKKKFPRLPVCLLLDGLYAKEPMFGICEQNDWKYITVLKDKSLKLLQEDVTDTAEMDRIRFERTVSVKQGREVVYADNQYQCIEGLYHKHYRVHWVEGLCAKDRVKESEEVQMNRFVVLTNLDTEKERGRGKKLFIEKIIAAGRLRWKIENEGFNTQKKGGYHLEHKFSERSIGALHVYYILLQMAHLINQIVEHSSPVVALLAQHPKLTIRYLWQRLRRTVEDYLLDRNMLMFNKRRSQIRLANNFTPLE